MPGELFASVDRLLVVLTRDGPSSSLPLSEEEFGDAEVWADRDAGARARLWRLGYLPAWEADLVSAVRAFQEESAVEVDGWIGPETWERLVALTTLESPVEVASWSREGTYLPALLRGAHLRLRMLGFLGDADPQGAVSGARARFERCARDLGLLGDEEDDATRLELLFAHRALFGALERWPDLDRVEDELDSDLHRMVLRLVQWELLQAGHPVPDTAELHWELGPAIAAYWKDAPEGTVRPPLGKRRRITVELIRALRADDTEPGPGAGLDLDGMVDALAEKSARVEEALSAVRGRGFFFWEPVGRSLRWLWNRVRQIGGDGAEATRRLLSRGRTALLHAARWLARRASEAATVFRRAIASVARHLEPVGVPGRSAVSGPPWADRTVWVHDASDTECVRATVADLVARNTRLQVAYDVIGVAIGVAVRLFAGPVGWTQAALAVARAWSAVRVDLDEAKLWRPGVAW